MLKEALRARTAGTAKEKQIFIFGHCRLTVLTPRLIRVEHCPDGAFEDRASTAVWYEPLMCHRARRHCTGERSP